MIRLRGTRNKKQKVTYEIKDFRGASNKLLEEARIAPNEAVTAKNLIQVQDGLWKTRWGTGYYGADIGDTIDGATEFVTSTGSTEVVAISGGVAYSSTDGGTWGAITGGSIFTADVQCYFLQIGGFLYIANGTDALARYDGASITTYASLAAPTGLGATKTSSLSGTGYIYWGQVTALNSVGETVGSTEVSTAVSKTRDSWTVATDKVTWKWNAVSTANRYQIYLSDESGDECLVTSTPSLSFIDDGSLAINPYVEPPEMNTTTAPKFISMCISGNRIWATNNTDAKYTVYFSGTGQFLGNFTDFYGGGWINLEKGGREMPTVVKHYQSGQGEGRATVLCKTPEGRGAVWQISISTATVGDTSFSVPSAIKVVGSFGTESPLGVVQTTNDIMFPNRRGWYNLGPRQNYYGILRTDEISTKIRPYWTSLNGSKIGSICAYYYDAKVFISVPTTSTGNDRIIILDTERNNWTVEWTIGAKQFFEYTDTSSVTHFLYIPLTGNKMIEISENIQGDLGVAFNTDYTSGRLVLAKFWKDFERVSKVYIKLGNPRGTINFEVSGTQKKSSFRSIASKTISPAYSDAGLGYDPLGSVELGDSAGTADLFADSSDLRYVNIRKKMRDIQLRVTSNTIQTDYTMLGFIIEGTKIETNPPRSWKI
jgi:hypothetical protein